MMFQILSVCRHCDEVFVEDSDFRDHLSDYNTRRCPIREDLLDYVDSKVEPKTMEMFHNAALSSNYGNGMNEPTSLQEKFNVFEEQLRCKMPPVPPNVPTNPDPGLTLSPTFASRLDQLMQECRSQSCVPEPKSSAEEKFAYERLPAYVMEAVNDVIG